MSSAAVPQRPCSGVAQPQSCMKESLTDTTLTLTIDRTTRSCRASKKSTLLELLLHLHITVGAIELQRTNECSSTGRARCAMQPPSRRRHADTSPPCRQQGVNRSSRRAAPASLHSRMCRLRTVPRTQALYPLAVWGLNAQCVMASPLPPCVDHLVNRVQYGTLEAANICSPYMLTCRP